MGKRGISPLIATVLLIGFTVVLAILVLTWVSSIIETQTEGTTTNIQAQTQCISSIGDISATFTGAGPYTINIINSGGVDFDNVKIIWQSSISSNSETTELTANLTGFSSQTSLTIGPAVYDYVILIPIIGEVECSSIEIIIVSLTGCGGGTCEVGETCATCPADCGACFIPNNNFCEIGEPCVASSGDCIGYVSNCPSNSICMSDHSGGSSCSNPSRACIALSGIGLCGQPFCGMGEVNDPSGDHDCVGVEECCVPEIIGNACPDAVCDVGSGETCSNCNSDCEGQQAQCSVGQVCESFNDWGMNVPGCLITCGAAGVGRCFDTPGCFIPSYPTLDPMAIGCDQGAPTCCVP